MKALVRLFPHCLQILLFMAVWLACDCLARLAGCPVPAGVLGLFVVTALLFPGILAAHQLEAGAQWLLSQMPLFFIPPLLSITEMGQVFVRHGLSLLVAILMGSAIVLCGTALIVDAMVRFESRLRARQPALA